MQHVSQAQILYLEDDEGIAYLTKAQLEGEGYQVDHVATVEEASARTQSEHYDVLILDYYLPDATGIEFVKSLGNYADDKVIIFTTASESVQNAIDALEIRAHDYIIKDVNGAFLYRLPHTVQSQLERQKMVLREQNLKNRLRVEREKLQFVNQFIKMATYRFRDPFTVIGMNAVMLRYFINSPKGREHIQRIEQQLERLQFILEQMLIINRLREVRVLELSAISLNDLFDVAIERYQRDITQKQISVIVTTDPDAQMVQGNETELFNALLQLLDNAIKFTHPGGTIHLSSRRVDDDVEIMVRDTGIGIPEQQIQYLSDLFYNMLRHDEYKDHQGLGLGLAIVKLIVNLHHATLNIKSTVDVGTTVVMRLASADFPDELLTQESPLLQ